MILRCDADCDKPGSVCQDPRFIGGDGLTFYFHGRKDSNFCLVSDSNLHINAHFIGKRRSGMARDFTWVQSIAILFGTHRFHVGALKTSTWDDSVDRISASFDGHVISLPQLDGATWTSSPGVYPQVSVKRVNADTNNLEVEVEGMLKITARVVPITVEDSRIHGYNVTEDDCLAHLDLGFKFQDLSDNVDGVLGQTYRSNYVSRVKIGVHMPVMGGDREFQTSGLFEPDCSAARFTGNRGSNGGRSKMELPEMSCASGVAVPSPTPPSSPPPPTTPPTPSVPSPPGTPTAPVPPYSPPATPTPSIPSPTPTPPGSTPPYFPPSSPTPTPPSDGEAGAGVRRARCKKKGSPCYGVEYSCPADCPRSCEVDCVTCKPLCNCDKPGSVCQDPRFIGGDGLTFYFHGKKDSNFCLISDSNLHINAHFIGKRRSGMARDFTWVQSIAILFGTHRFYVGALNTSTWDDSLDRISASFDGHVISLPQLDGATWTSSLGVYPQVSVKRVNADTNNLEVEVEGMLKITARVVPITVEDSRIHGYNVTEDDCLAHLDLGFKFHDLSDNVDGVLGQTYRSNYVSRVKIGVHMPVMGGDREFQTTGLFEPDCSAARFTGNRGRNGGRSNMELPEMSCASGVGGKGVVCKR
ncbi:hypothetical protein F2Q68_00017206 [Brassica cretica]|uniref:Uncharacterized protein n=1 Tax=Brassica cretica TaxID=69181 RepID=A0A8S9HD60_BRACR|nr:hypothetical protein F2Q68_00017206 [Brassica cretica]